MLKKFIRYISLVMAAVLLGGCGGPGDYTPTGDGLTPEDGQVGSERPGTAVAQELTMPYYPQITMNPLQCTDYTNRAFMSLLYQGLFAVDRNYQVVPILCGQYSMAEDMKSYIFYVDPSATFSDGSQVRASDVVATLLAAKDSAYYGGRFLHGKNYCIC